MSRELIESALVDGNRNAFQMIAKDYIDWLSTQDLMDVQSRYFMDCEKLAADFYRWVINGRSVTFDQISG